MLDYVQCLVLVCFICVRRQPLPHRQVPLMKMRGIWRIWGFAVLPVHSRGQRKIPSGGKPGQGENPVFRIIEKVCTFG